MSDREVCRCGECLFCEANDFAVVRINTTPPGYSIYWRQYRWCECQCVYIMDGFVACDEYEPREADADA